MQNIDWLSSNRKNIKLQIKYDAEEIQWSTSNQGQKYIKNLNAKIKLK